MATRSPTQFHSFWGAYITALLPTSAEVEVGDTAFDSTLNQLVVCTAVGPVVWSPVGGGSSIWSADVEPISDATYVAASSYQRGGVNPFTQWNVGGVPAPYSTVPYGLQLSAPASSATIFGYTSALPAVAGVDEFSMTMKLPFEGAPVSGGGTVFGIIIGRDLIANPATGGFLASTINWSTSPASTGNAVFVFNQSNYATFGVTLKTYQFSDIGVLPGPYAQYAQAAPGSMMRLSVDAAHANYAVAISTDGEVWFEIQGPRSLPGDIPGVAAINSIGIVAYNAATLARRFWVPWFRYRQGAGVYRNYSPEGGLT